MGKITGSQANTCFSAAEAACPERRNSCPSKIELDLIKKVTNVSHTSSALKRSDASFDLHQMGSNNELMHTTKIEFNKNMNASDLNSKDYVYCGMAEDFPVNNFGMSLDEAGNLLMIKGREYNLIKGVFKKYTSEYHYKIAKITDNSCKIKFENLYINNDGKLIGDEKETGKSYVINITPNICENDSEGQWVTVDFVECEKKSETDLLTFRFDDKTSASYFLDSGKIYLKSIETENRDMDVNLINFEIAIPLKKKLTLSA